MTRMLRELRVHPELGLLHADGGWLFGGPAVVEYWRGTSRPARPRPGCPVQRPVGSRRRSA